MAARKRPHYYRRPRTANEKRANVEGTWNRAKRSLVNLVDCWEDKPLHREKGWKYKTKYKKQWERNL